MRCLIVDDHPLLRGGVRQRLAARWPEARLHEADSLARAEAIVAAEALDCVVLDISLPDAMGLDGLTRLQLLAPELPILVLSAHSEAAYGTKALRQGAAGYLNKRCHGGELVQALEHILAGGRYITTTLALRLAGMLASGQPGQPPHETLSAQEFRVLLHLGSGLSVGGAAHAMCLSVKTVSTYRRRLLDKLDLDSNAALTGYCLSHDLIRL